MTDGSRGWRGRFRSSKFGNGWKGLERQRSSRLFRWVPARFGCMRQGMAVKVCKGGARRCDAGFGCLGMAAHVEERNGKFSLGCLGRALYGAVWPALVRICSVWQSGFVAALRGAVRTGMVRQSRLVVVLHGRRGQERQGCPGKLAQGMVPRGLARLVGVRQSW